MLPPEISRIEYSALTPVAGRLIPYETQAMRGRKIILSVKVLDISKIVMENPERFLKFRPARNSGPLAMTDTKQNLRIGFNRRIR